MEFRTLRAEEIDVRVQQVKDNGAILLLYKDARCDMRILDETVTPFWWQRDHKEFKGNIYCGVGIRTPKKTANDKFEYTGDYVWKWDAGAESFTDKEKGEASDSFKRACFNWGIGRELYSAPFIWIASNHYTGKINNQGKPTTYDKFEVEGIKYNNDREIIKLAIKNKSTGKRVFLWDKENK